MAGTDFDRFVQRQTERKQKSEAFDAKRELKEWREKLEQLYASIEDFMAGYIKGGVAKIDFEPIEINEEFSGIYTVNQLILTIGPSAIKFKPIGTMLIGSKGRVDVIGPLGTARFVLVDKNLKHAGQMIRVSVTVEGEAPPKEEARAPDWTWKLVSPAPDMRFIDLDQATFFDVILSVADA